MRRRVAAYCTAESVLCPGVEITDLVSHDGSRFAAIRWGPALTSSQHSNGEDDRNGQNRQQSTRWQSGNAVSDDLATRQKHACVAKRELERAVEAGNNVPCEITWAAGTDLA